MLVITFTRCWVDEYLSAECMSFEIDVSQVFFMCRVGELLSGAYLEEDRAVKIAWRGAEFRVRKVRVLGWLRRVREDDRRVVYLLDDGTGEVDLVVWKGDSRGRFEPGVEGGLCEVFAFIRFWGGGLYLAPYIVVGRELDYQDRWLRRMEEVRDYLVSVYKGSEE